MFSNTLLKILSGFTAMAVVMVTFSACNDTDSTAEKSPMRPRNTDNPVNTDQARPVDRGEEAKGVVGGTDDPNIKQHNRDEAAKHAPDNTGRNTVDRNEDTLTPMDQSETSQDIEITSEIRRVIMSNGDFSSLAKNVKIITKAGVVTLRGPVAISGEIAAIQEIAEGVRGVRRVDSELEVVR